MSGSFILKYKDGRNDEYLAHEYIFSLDPAVKSQKLAPIRRDYKNKVLTFHCTCKEPYPQMTLGHYSKTDRYYIRSFSKKDHADDCKYKDSDTSSSLSLYQKGFVKEDNGLIDIKLDGQDFQIKKKATKKEGASLAGTAPLPKENIAVTSHQPTIFAIMWRLLNEAWNTVVQFSHYKGYEYPSNDAKTIYKHLVSATINAYSLQMIPMKNFMYKGEAIGKIYHIEKNLKKKFNVETAGFTILRLENDGISKSDDVYTLTLHSPVIKNNHEINVPAKLHDDALKAIRHLPGPYFAGGFVKNMGYKKTPQFISFALIPINDFGVPVESSYERKLYTELCVKKRPFLKCFESMDAAWNGFIPDGLLIDTKPSTILEVFGMSKSIKDYHIQREIKINHFSTLKSKYNLWYWDAFTGQEFPQVLQSLPPKASEN